MQSNDSIDLTRVGPGTVMGAFMRQYWMPACLSSEVKADGDPVRLMIMCEKLIAFRDSSGRVGIMDHRCPHRCASLFIGRNEANGIRCVYHGWKFDVDGKCVDMPSVPARMDFKEKVHAKAYKTHEANGLIWVYMGENQANPPPPRSRRRCIPRPRSGACSAIATGCRRWKATSTPAMSASCMSAPSRRTIWTKTTRCARPCWTARPNMRWRRPTGA
jgi:nitrite reductase/ring-hydroxylating ferredoxin subunit